MKLTQLRKWADPKWTAGTVDVWWRLPGRVMGETYGLGLYRRKGPGAGRYFVQGVVVTSSGVMSVYADGQKTQLDFVYDGYLFIRTLQRTYTERGVRQAASAFARYMVRTRPHQKDKKR